MTLSSRKTMIRDLWFARVGLPLAALLPVTRAEIRESVRQTVHSRPLNDDREVDSPVDQLPDAVVDLFDAPQSVGERVSTDSILTPAERRQLNRDLAPLRAFRRAVASLPLRLCA